MLYEVITDQLFIACRIDGGNDAPDDGRVMQEVLAEPFPGTVTQGVIRNNFV